MFLVLLPSERVSSGSRAFPPVGLREDRRAELPRLRVANEGSGFIPSLAFHIGEVGNGVPYPHLFFSSDEE